VADETKNMIKNRIDKIEDLEPKEEEDLIRVKRSLGYDSNGNNSSISTVCLHLLSYPVPSLKFLKDG
jgi:hypothetical protein